MEDQTYFYPSLQRSDISIALHEINLVNTIRHLL